MHFIYEEYINRVSEYDYNVDEMFNWIITHYDPSGIIEALEGSATPKDIVEDIFDNCDEWHDSFVVDMDIEKKVTFNLTEYGIAKQVKEFIGDKLLAYYTKNWENIKNKGSINIDLMDLTNA